METDKHKRFEACKHNNGFCYFKLFVAIMLSKSRVSACFQETTEFRLEGTLGDLESKALLKALRSDQHAQGIIRLGFSNGWIAQPSLDNLFNCLTVPMVKKLFLTCNFNLHFFNLPPLFHVLQPLIPLESLIHPEASSQVEAGWY